MQGSDTRNILSKIQVCTVGLFSAGRETLKSLSFQGLVMHLYWWLKLKMNGEAGAGIHCEHFSHYFSLGTAKTVIMKLRWLKLLWSIIMPSCPSLSEHAIIFSESQAMILPIGNYFQAPSSLSEMEYRDFLRELHEIYKQPFCSGFHLTVVSSPGIKRLFIPGDTAVNKRMCWIKSTPYSLLNCKSVSSKIKRHAFSITKRTNKGEAMEKYHQQCPW